MAEPIVTVPLQGPLVSSAYDFLSRTAGALNLPSDESNLLRSIRVALRGSDTELLSTIQSTTFCCGSDPNMRELTWNAHTVVISYGGVMIKKWNFQEESESIQWACLGELEQHVATASLSTHGASHYTNEEPTSDPKNASKRPTFGPFARGNINSKLHSGRQELVAAVFVFLRSIGKIFLQNGLEYTFSLPFIVRKAWPVSPHGVMIQRVLESSEFIEAEITGEAVLPTIFSVTSPFSEATAVGLTTGIIGGFHGLAASLKDEDENSSRPLKSIPPTEMVVWASHQGMVHNGDALITPNDVLVSVDVDKCQLSVWRYVYIKPMDTPLPLGQTHTRNNTRKRKSMSVVGSRRTSALMTEMGGRVDRLHPLSPKGRSRDTSPTPELFDLPEMPPLSSLPGMPPSLSTATTMQSLVTGTSSSHRSQPSKGRRNSLTRNDLSVTMDRMVLGGRLESDITLAPIEHGRMKAAYWMERVYTQEIFSNDAINWRNISVSMFDGRWDGTTHRSLMSVCFPGCQEIQLLAVSYGPDNMMKVKLHSRMPGISAISLRATRFNVWDLLVLKPQGNLVLLTHGIREIPIDVNHSIGVKDVATIDHGRVVAVQDSVLSSITFVFQDGYKARANIELYPRDTLTTECLLLLALTITPEASFTLHRKFIQKWAKRALSTADSVEFECFTEALYSVFRIGNEIIPVPLDPWLRLAYSTTHTRFCEDPVMKFLKPPFTCPPAQAIRVRRKPHALLSPILSVLHSLGEHLRLLVSRYDSVVRLAPVICRIALEIRPEWADYWKRLVPDATAKWPSPSISHLEDHDDRLPVWPLDISAILYSRLSRPDWTIPKYDPKHIATCFDINPSYEYGLRDPLIELHQLSGLYNTLADEKVPESQKRAENAVLQMVISTSSTLLDSLPMGIAAPLREAARTCQLAPPSHWPVSAYRAIGRNDLAASGSNEHDVLFNDGYRSMKDFINPTRSRQTIGEIVAEARAAGNGDVDAVSGVELDLQDFTDIRFGQDRRLEEVARILCSSSIPSIKSLERPELNEHDQTKEHQNQVIRVAERTLALPYGRAMFTFGSVPTVTREAYAIPKLEYSVRILPLNITVSPEPAKIPPESLNWGEFHNGVAAGLRISPNSGAVESSWIAFNKPSELTPEHAGFLLGLGLTGHLKEMLTWHTFGYLTPKHDLTSIGVLLGLSAANIGSSNQHVTKLLAVHTPALLPTPNVDLNVSLVTQAAGLAGVGLLYLGTKNRRMAEVCLNQISRKDLVQPDLSNEHREAYTYAAALAFGMIMLGKGSMIPADMTLLSRLSALIHGDTHRVLGTRARAPFDINLTSPAATIALGLMYLKTERQDVADILTIPDTILALNRIQPSFLLIRTIAKSLIMWDEIAPTNEWLAVQIPESIREAIEMRSKFTKPIDDAFELAYYNILAGCCFVVGLKYAGTARQEAYIMIVRYFDLFTRLVYSNGPAFDHKIKRSAVRDGLNLISISLSMVMAGTGEITCLRRLRYAYGMYQQAMYHHGFRYGVHVATHMSLGLLFLGGGRFTLGTSDAAIACMVTAFFPRFHHLSSDNKSFLQALRHLWVLAVEPRCLIARDVDTGEVVYLPVKIAVMEAGQVERSQLISPTLIPDMDKLMSIRVDTPRYWPFYLDTAALPRHKEALLKSQTLYVKRRTAFLSYTEDPRGSRSLFVRSGSSAGDAATLDFPQLTDTKTHPAGDLSEFITSFSNDVLFLAFADHFCRETGETPDEQLFHTYCHAALLDSILQDKPQTLQTHLTLFKYRTMDASSRYFHLRLQDLKFAADFYSKIYDRRFSGRVENNPRPPLIRDTTVLGALHVLDQRLDELRTQPGFSVLVGRYARGERTGIGIGPKWKEDASKLAWYLLRGGVPVAAILKLLRGLARDAHMQCLAVPPPNGTDNAAILDLGIKEVVWSTGTKMTSALGSGWSVRSLDEVVAAWTQVDIEEVSAAV